jgi:hypothetical protein
MLREIGSAMNDLKRFRDDAQNVAISLVKESGKTATDPTPRINQFLEYFTTIPIDIDPTGIVPKIEHILDVRESEVKGRGEASSTFSRGEPSGESFGSRSSHCPC